MAGVWEEFSHSFLWGHFVSATPPACVSEECVCIAWARVCDIITRVKSSWNIWRKTSGKQVLQICNVHSRYSRHNGNPDTWPFVANSIEKYFRVMGTIYILSPLTLPLSTPITPFLQEPVISEKSTWVSNVLLWTFTKWRWEGFTAGRFVVGRSRRPVRKHDNPPAKWQKHF